MSILYEMTISKAASHVLMLTDVAELNKLKLEEVRHPRFSGGREEILTAIDHRRKFLLDVATSHEVKEKILKYICVVDNLTWDNGDKIKKGSEVSRLSRHKLEFYIEIQGVIQVER